MATTLPASAAEGPVRDKGVSDKRFRCAASGGRLRAAIPCQRLVVSTMVVGMTRVHVRATYVEIPAEDLERAERFYRGLFGASVRRTVVDGRQCCILDDDSDAAGAVIALMQGESYVPSVDGTRVYVSVDDVEAVVARAQKLGGSILYPVTEVVDGLIVAELADSEGNRIALSNQ